ncbi:hypothetical protein BGX27_001008 [Mortierella sp. AM989]|nr:hypothetical protein BGX27_001008 [Mortierella sp. AM989]
MSQFQETNPYTQRVASNKAMEEFLVEMDNWDYIDTSALTCELTGVNDSFNLASQDEVTPFQLLRSQVQLEIELGIDNPSSRFALDLISAPTLLSPATPAPIGVLAANSVFFTSSESCSLRDPQVNYGSSQLQLQEIPAPVVPSQGCQSVPWGLPWQPYLNSPLPTPALSQTFSASTAETHLNVPVMNPFSEQHQHSRNFNPQLFERRTTGANRVTEIQQSLSQTQNELTTNIKTIRLKINPYFNYEKHYSSSTIST